MSLITPKSSEGNTTGISSPLGSVPPSTRVGKVRLAVSNLEASLGFYRDTVGMHQIGELTLAGSNPLARLGTAAGVILLELEQVPDTRPMASRTRLGLYHTALLLPTRSDLGSLVAHLDAHGTYYGASDHLVSEAIYLVDPDGLTLEVYADRPRPQWRYKDGMIVSGVFPLDKVGLKNAALSPWMGVPAGTIMGHIHFYVADLERSSRFYHHAMGLDLVMQVPGALFASAGGYHHQVGYNVFAAGSPPATVGDPRVLYWELIVPDAEALNTLTGRLRKAAASVEETDTAAPSFLDGDGIRVTVRADNNAGS